MGRKKRKDKPMPLKELLEGLGLSPDEEAAHRLGPAYPFPLAELVSDGDLLERAYSIAGLHPYFFSVRHRRLGEPMNELLLVNGAAPAGDGAEYEGTEYVMSRIRGLPCDAATMRLAGKLAREWRKGRGDATHGEPAA